MNLLLLSRVFGDIPLALDLFLLFVASGTAFLALWKGIYTPLKRHTIRVNAGMDTLLGYPPVTDPGSGRELQPATPPLAQRVYDLEETNRKMADALEVLAKNQNDLLTLQQEMAERKIVGDKIVADFMLWREKVDRALDKWIAEQDQLAALVRETTTEEKEQE